MIHFIWTAKFFRHCNLSSCDVSMHQQVKGAVPCVQCLDPLLSFFCKFLKCSRLW